MLLKQLLLLLQLPQWVQLQPQEQLVAAVVDRVYLQWLVRARFQVVCLNLEQVRK